MALNTSALQVAAAALAADITVIKLHTGDPGSDGTANNTTAGSQTVTCTSTGGVTTVPTTSFSGGAASGPCTYVSMWGGGGTVFRGAYALTGDQTFNASGNYTVDSIALTGSST